MAEIKPKNDLCEIKIKYVCCKDNDCNANRESNREIKEIVETNKANIYPCGEKLKDRKVENGDQGKSCDLEVKLTAEFETDQKSLRSV